MREVSKQSLTYQKANIFVLNYIDKDKQNVELLKLAIKNNLQTIQFCYSILYPKIYARPNAFGIQNKGISDFVYSEWKKKNALLFIETPIVNELPFTQITKNTSAKIDAKSLNDARVAKRNEKKENLKRQLQQNTEKMNAIKKQKL